MPDTSSSRLSYSAAALFLLVIAFLIAPLGALVSQVIAQTMGGNQPPRLLVEADPLSDAVSATAAEFRVDESGAATYSIPLYTVPGTAGVVPHLTLSYSSQNGDGPVGKGWAIGGLSSISRCRATREAGDFIGAATPDGNPRPINFSATDRFCLDGQRLIPSSATCLAASGMTAAALATEIDSFQRVCAYTVGSATTGPNFFTVERKDGSISWYGDRDNNNSQNRPDGYFETNSALAPTAALTWAQTRFQDSTGNYIDYLYLENPAGAGTGEHLISEIRYTGKTILVGQSGSASAPYAKVVFNYAVRPAAKWTKGYASGGMLTQSRSLSSITSCATLVCSGPEQARHYLLTYAASASGSNLDTLIGLQECRDSTAAICASPTAFVWSQGKYEFATQELPSGFLYVSDVGFNGIKYGDLNGDGRADLINMRAGVVGCPSTTIILTALSALDGNGRPTFPSSSYVCTPALNAERGEGSWHLLDYNGDGRDDLFVSGPDWQGWRLHPSNGSGFDASQNLIAGLDAIIPSYPGKNDQVQLADLNGDGLTDVVYPNGGALRARIMERQSGGFGWGAEKTIAIDQASVDDCNYAPNVTCSYTVAGAPTPKTGFSQLTDFNGDATSDLLIKVTTTSTRTNYGTPGCPIEPIAPPESQSTDQPSLVIMPYVLQEDSPVGVEESLAAGPCVVTTITSNLHALSVQSLGTTGVAVASTGVVSPGNPETLTFADANGDGLTDVFYRATADSDWIYRINRGTGFISGGTLAQTEYRNQTRFQDINGDGRADALVLTNYGSYKAYAVRYALSTGGYAASASPMPGGGARLCSGGCNPDRFVSMFTDLDADGILDFVSFELNENPPLFVSRANTRFEPRDTLVKVVNGLGSETDITYAPLTNKDLYRRDTGSRNGLNWGRGAPVLDLLASSYVVARVSSSSPQLGAPGAKATLHYRYAGARVQAGGRGFLGFREMVTIDPNQTGGYVVTTTTYAQNFPFMGMPIQTVKAAVLNQAYLVPTCLNSAVTDACYATPGQSFPSLGGSVFSNSVQSWEVAPVSLAAQTPLHVRTLGSEESLRDPYTGAQTSKVNTAFGYGSYGNVTQTVVDTFNGTEGSPAATVITANTYGDDVAKWRLGRLTSSTITHRRPGQSDVVRATGFSYDMSGAATGLMTEERTQPGGAADQALTKAYSLDHYGNRVQAVTCAAPATSCSTSGFQFHPAGLEAVKRYSRVEYDAQGRFPVATVEPFWNGASGEERVTSRVLERNVFGDPVNAIDVNNVRTFAFKGGLGRDYFTWVQTSPNATPGNGGLSSTTTYRWCASQVNCPAGAKVRQQVVSAGSPRQWTYLDALGRPVMKAMESFNAGVIDQDVSASCTDFDVTGKPKRTSNPFFLAGTAGTDGPSGLDNVCVAAARQWTVTSYDVLGRPVQVVTPDGSQAFNSYNGLTTTATDPRGNPTVQTRNGKGELVTVTDAAGLVTTYSYTADGNLRAVSRDAGAGTITNAFTYDGLGRKIQQIDPDAGTTNFQYNAMGEMIAQTDASGQRVEHEIDGRGRVWRKTVKQSNGMVETQSTFTFDTAQNGSGSLTSETITGNYSGWANETGTALNFTRYQSYDALGRPQSGMTVIDDGMYGTFTEYDALGRPWKSRDASDQWTKTQYGPRGVVAVCASEGWDLDPSCPANGNTYQRILATDAWGNVTKERRGDSAAMEVVRSYHAQTGRIATICAGNTACNLTNEAYVWDAAGNLSSHQKEQRYLEAFTYDALNRLVESKMLIQNGVVTNQVTLAQGYDQLGNVCTKNGLGYDYAGADGCGGAAMMSSAMTANAASVRAGALLPAYQRPKPARWRLPAAWRETRAHQAPETATRRYSDDDRPSWDREADRWGLDDDLRLGPHERFWVRSKPRQATKPVAFQSTARPTAAAVAGTQSATVMSVTGSPHAVSQSGTGTGASFYYYDTHGNQTLRDAPGTASDRTIKYSVDDKAYEIAMGSGQRVRFWYGPDGQRYKREEAGKTTLYLGGVEVVIQGGGTTFKRYLGGIALQTVTGGVVNSTKYLFHDHLGSLVRIANADGSVSEGLDYAPFGSRRSYTNPLAAGTGTTTTDRSFTGHEAVDGTGVIHMNGRIYDAEVGRFLQADPVIQAPDNTQSWNAYTYCFNNPLAYTDPSGNISLRQVLGIVIAVVGMYFMPYASNVWINIAYGAAVGFASGYVATGTLRGGVTGAFTGGMTMGIASLGLDIWGQMAFQAMTGGIVEGINGGNFGNGFLAAGLSTAFIPQMGYGNLVQRSVTGALVGGTISKLTGGKFANGAISGAIQGAMSKRRGQQASVRQDEPAGVFDRIGKLFSKAYRSLMYPAELNSPVVLNSMEGSWEDALPGNPYNRHEEGGFWGFEKDGSYGTRRWVDLIPDRSEITPPVMEAGNIYKGLRVMGEWHIHPNPRPVDEFGVRWISKPSGSDIRTVINANYSGASYIIDNQSVIRMSNTGTWNILDTHDAIFGGD
ncbi:FG-GAP-like repeat-containing protein [Pseudoxanthomonas sp. CF125]|uniref:FG-GAP-like repeat-containing protein n=1 Tax=Pseudoxanthomonas sp. CF125 TaxID=1855303 RepID=UPI00089215A7|nr:FG-GAP-like repeat-containing protein [Pseudoxanthomonas sp. CF125]SDQ92661.1 RHS repeat-associated core domain-containing protein [Pseudoxanthomonas sp. CF125]